MSVGKLACMDNISFPEISAEFLLMTTESKFENEPQFIKKSNLVQVEFGPAQEGAIRVRFRHHQIC